MNKKLWVICALIFVMLLTFAACGVESETPNTQTESSGETTEKAETSTESDNTLGKYTLEILGCRLAKDYEGKDIVIVKYSFTNNDDDAASFSFAFDDGVFQNGVGLNESLFVADNANFSADNQTKEIKTGASLEVEVAYELNDTETKIDVEVSELISFSDKKVTKSFEIK